MTTTTTTKARIRTVSWTVPGVAEGDAKTLRAAERAIADARSRVGHLAARIAIFRDDNSIERRAC
jgi:hypothetical protein